MMNLYAWLKFAHLAGLAVFLLGHGVSAGASLVLRKPLSGAARGALLQLSLRSHYVAFPGLLVVLVSGVWMGFLGNWWRMGWVWTSIGVLVLVVVVMSVLSIPYHQLRDAVKEDRPEDEVAGKLSRTRPLVLAWTGALGLLAIFFLMSLKPF